MPKALIIDFDTTGATGQIGTATPSQILAHARSVRQAFEAFKPVGWTSEILITSSNEAVGSEPDVVARLPVTQNITTMTDWVRDNGSDYDIAIMPLIYDNSNLTFISRIPEAYDLPLFMPMSNEAVEFVGTRKSNIIFCGGGSSVNVRGVGLPIEHFDIASNRTSNQTATSYTCAVVAARGAWFISQGLTKAQMRKAIRYASTLYPDWSSTNGWGKIQQNLPESYLLEPPQSFVAIRYADGGFGYTQFMWVSFIPQTQDGIRIYANGQVVYQGQGLDNNFAFFRGQASENIRIAVISDSEFSGATTLELRAYQGETESRSVSYLTTSETYPASSPTPPDPQPLPPEPEPEPDPITPINPNPNVFITRTASSVTATQDGGGATTEWQRRTSVEGEWQAVSTDATYAFTPDPKTTYQLRVRVSDGTTTSAWGEAFSRANGVSPVNTLIL